jgi:hypothetical protein
VKIRRKVTKTRLDLKTKTLHSHNYSFKLQNEKHKEPQGAIFPSKHWHQDNLPKFQSELNLKFELKKLTGKRTLWPVADLKHLRLDKLYPKYFWIS